MHILQGDDSPQLAAVGQHRKTEEVGFLEESHQLGQRCILMDGHRLAAHDLADLDGLHDIQVPALGEPHPALGQLHGIDRFGVQPLGEITGRDPGHHQRQNHEIVVAHLEDDEHGGERCPGGGREQSGHAYQGEGAGVEADVRKPPAEEVAHGPAQHGPGKERRGKDPAGVAGAEGERGGERFEKNKRHQDPQRGMALDRRLDKGEPGAVHMWNLGVNPSAVGRRAGREAQIGQMHIGEADQTEAEAADRGLEQLGEFPPVENVFGQVQHPDEHDADQGRGKPENQVEDDFHGAVHSVGRHLEGELEADEVAADDGGGHGGNDHIAEGPHLQPAYQHLDGKSNPGDGGVEGCGNSGCRPAGDEVADSFVGEAEHLAHGGAERRADLDDRAFASG